MAALSSSIAAARRISGRATSVSMWGDSRAQEIWRFSVRPLSCDRVLLSLAVEYQKRDECMKTTLLAVLITVVLSQGVWAQQVPRPAPPPGMKTKSETGEAEILKVYAAEDQGAKFRAYVIKYKDNEVILNDDLAVTDKKVGDKVKFMVHRYEAPAGKAKIHTMQFKIFDIGALMKK